MAKLLRAAGSTDVMRFTPKQAAYFLSEKRFNMCPAGRRSGKTAIAKRRLVKKALCWTGLDDARFIASAPVQHQAKRIYWNDLKRMVPKIAIVGMSESYLTIDLRNGAQIQVMGMDKPERVEGSPVAHLLFDEYGNMKEEAWTDHAFPTLTDTGGSADFIGVPEGRNHYFHMWTEALIDEAGEWDCHTWYTAEVLPMYMSPMRAASELATARRTLDPLTYKQEYEADFNNFEGRIYYPFQRDTHARERLQYKPRNTLYLCFDFNVSPGVCVYCQDQEYRGSDDNVAGIFTAVIGEVYIPRDSNTPAVCRKIIADWGRRHQGEIHVFGDATGGAKTTSSTDGSDWDIVREHLRPVFGNRLRMRVKRSNPLERVRVNALNSRLLNAEGTKRLLVDPVHAPKTVEDLEAVCVKEGTNGEIDKDSDPTLTHLTDALGYFVEAKHPMRSVNRMEIGSAYAQSE